MANIITPEAIENLKREVFKVAELLRVVGDRIDRLADDLEEFDSRIAFIEAKLEIEPSITLES